MPKTDPFKNHTFTEDTVNQYLQQANESTLICMNDEFDHGDFQNKPTLVFEQPFWESIPNGLQMIRARVHCNVCHFSYYELYDLSSITMRRPITLATKGIIPS